MIQWIHSFIRSLQYICLVSEDWSSNPAQRLAGHLDGINEITDPLEFNQSSRYGVLALNGAYTRAPSILSVRWIDKMVTWVILMDNILISNTSTVYLITFSIIMSYHLFNCIYHAISCGNVIIPTLTSINHYYFAQSDQFQAPIMLYQVELINYHFLNTYKLIIH